MHGGAAPPKVTVPCPSPGGIHPLLFQLRCGSTGRTGAKLGSPPHPPAMERSLGGRECCSKAPCEAPAVLGCLAGVVWSLLPASHFWEMNVLGWLFIYSKIFFFFPLASSRNACVGLLISQVLQSGETHLSSGPKSTGSSVLWEAGRVFPVPLGVPAHAPGSPLVPR